MKTSLPYILFIQVILLTACHHFDAADKENSGTIKAGNMNVYYEREGKGEPVILLHAGLQDHSMWEEQVKALSPEYEVITVDLPYHGKTTGADTSLLAAEMIKIVMDSLHLDKVSVAGLSMGAYVAQDLLLAYPERVKKAILISAGVHGYDETHPTDYVSMAWYSKFTGALDDKDTARAAMEFTRAWAEGIYRSGDSLKAPVSQYIYKNTLKNLKSFKMQGWPKLQDHPPAIERLSSIKVPVLIIDGDKDLPYITANSELMEKNIPGARRVVMKGVAHMINIEKPAELNKLMLDFLKSK